MLLEWRDVAPIADLSQLKVWTSLTTHEASNLRKLAKGKNVLEIGAAFGYSTLVLASVARHVTSVDPHTAPVVPGNFNFVEQADMDRYAGGTLNTLIENLDRTQLGSRVHIVRELSQHYLPVRALTIPEPNFAFIDGDHSYDVEMQDLVQCARLGVKVMAVHDYEEDLNPDVKPVVLDFLADNPGWRMVKVVDTLAILEKKK